jgi:hypothetical protein
MPSQWKQGDPRPASAWPDWPDWPDWGNHSNAGIEARNRNAWIAKGTLPMPALYAYLDETGDPKKDDAIFICGYAGWDDKWNQFGSCWVHELRMAKVSAVHATELFVPCGEFAGWDSVKVDDFAGRCIDVIRSTIPIGIAVGFDTKHYRTLSLGHRNEIGRPLLACMSRVIDIAIGFVAEMRARGDHIPWINLCFDDSEKDALEMLRTWIDLKKARPNLVDSIASVGFADDRRFSPIQAADLFANLTNKCWQPDFLKKPSSSDRIEHHYRNLLTPDPSFPCAHRVSFITAADIDDAVRRHERLY